MVRSREDIPFPFPGVDPGELVMMAIGRKQRQDEVVAGAVKFRGRKTQVELKAVS